MCIIANKSVRVCVCLSFYMYILTHVRKLRETIETTNNLYNTYMHHISSYLHVLCRIWWAPSSQAARWGWAGAASSRGSPDGQEARHSIFPM